MLHCIACLGREVIWPVMVCWFCRQGGVKVPRVPGWRQKGPPSWKYRWTAAEDARLLRLFPHRPTPDLVKLFPGRDRHSLDNRAHRLKIYKSAACWARIKAASGRILTEAGRPHRYRHGQVPPNKGVKGRPAVGGSRDTLFRPGNRPHTWRPIGSTRVSKDGYLEVKVRDGHRTRNFRSAHVLLWEQHHGPVPAEHAIVFRDGDKARIVIENLECLSRAELMARNTIHRASMPEELRDVLRQLAGFRSRITKLEQRRARGQENDGRSERAPLRGDRAAEERQARGAGRRAAARQGHRPSVRGHRLDRQGRDRLREGDGPGRR